MRDDQSAVAPTAQTTDTPAEPPQTMCPHGYYKACGICDLERPARGAADAVIGSASGSTGTSAPAEPQTPEPICVCQVDDGLVQEWVSKARAVAISKGFNPLPRPLPAAPVTPSPERTQHAGEGTCKCGNCSTVLHWSDCAVHNMPAEPNGPCDCGVTPEPPLTTLGCEQDGSEHRFTLGEDTCDCGIAPRADARPAPLKDWPDPTPEMLNTPEFEAVWQCIKSWDINVPGAYSGYCGASGNHVRAILDALLSGGAPHGR